MTLSIDLMADDIIRQFVDRVAPGVTVRIERGLDEVLRAAEKDWPVGVRAKRGRYRRDSAKPHSRDLFRKEIRLERSGTTYRVVGAIRNGAEYWRFIRAKKLRGGSAIVVYVRRPVEALRDQIRDEIPDIVRRTRGG